MKRHYLSTIILLILTSFSCSACKCKTFEITPDIYFSYKLIFIGHLDTIVEKERGTSEREITFYVDQIFRGDSIEKVTFKNISTGSCRGTYKKGNRYLIYIGYDKKNEIFFRFFGLGLHQLPSH